MASQLHTGVTMDNSDKTKPRDATRDLLRHVATFQDAVDMAKAVHLLGGTVNLYDMTGCRRSHWIVEADGVLSSGDWSEGADNVKHRDMATFDAAVEIVRAVHALGGSANLYETTVEVYGMFPDYDWTEDEQEEAY